MKKSILAFTLLLCLVLLPVTAQADGIDITDSFTDENFLAAVYDALPKKTAPDPIFDTDVAGIGYLDVSRRNIENLDGIEYFTTLMTLHCTHNQLTSLPDLPDTLKHLSCDNNRLTSLPNLPASLEELYCGNNRLTSLPDLPSTLEKLYCSNNRLTSLPALPSTLEKLYCSNNRLTSLPALPVGLQILICSSNQLKGFDVTNLPLTQLYCQYNHMTHESDVVGFFGAWDNTNFIFDPQRAVTINTQPGCNAATYAGCLAFFVFIGFLRTGLKKP